MPMIEVTYPEGAIPADAKDALIEELATVLLKAERAPDTEFFRSITWVYVNEIPSGNLYAGGRPGGEARFRVNITVPAGALSDRRKGELVEGVTAAVTEAAGLTEADGLRVWTLIRDVPDGNWGAAGQQVRYQNLVAVAKGERAQEAVVAP